MKKKNRKYSLIILLSLVVIGINLLAVSRRSGKITGKRSARIDGTHYYKKICRPVTLIGRRNRQLPEGKAALLIAFNRESLEEIDELIMDLMFENNDVSVFLIKNNLPFFLPRSRTFYKIQDRNWLTSYGLSNTDDFIMLIDRENRIRYLDNYSVDHRKIRLLLSRYNGGNA